MTFDPTAARARLDALTENDRLTAENEQLRAALRQAADELDEYYRN